MPTVGPHQKLLLYLPLESFLYHVNTIHYIVAMCIFVSSLLFMSFFIPKVCHFCSLKANNSFNLLCKTFYNPLPTVIFFSFYTTALNFSLSGLLFTTHGFHIPALIHLTLFYLRLLKPPHASLLIQVLLKVHYHFSPPP